MSARTPSPAPLQRQRLPFLGLLALAATGILAAHSLSFDSRLWLLCAAASLLAFLTTRHGCTLAAFVISVFAAVHLWQDRESPAAVFARQVGPGTLLCEIRGVVSSEPRMLSETTCGFELAVKEIATPDGTIHPDFLIQVLWPGLPPAYGDAIEATGTLERLTRPRNPGQFDFAEWSERQGIYLQLQIDHGRDSRIVAHGLGNPLYAAAQKSRAWMRHTLEQGIDDPLISGLIVAMVIGDTSDMPEATQEEFRGTGTFHLFSVSGLHVGMLTILLWYVFRTLQVPRRYAAVAIIPLLFFYVVMTGIKPASVRAAVMAAIVLLGFLASRRPIVPNSLFAAAFLILVFNTNELFNPGFQLSFTVVAAILLLAGPASAKLQRPFEPDPFIPEKLLTPVQRLVWLGGRKTASLAGVSAAAWAGSLPLTLGYFHLVSFTALPANMLAVPVSFAIMAVSMLSLSAGVLSTWAAEVYNQTNWLLAKLLLAIVSTFAAMPGSYQYVGAPSPGQPEVETVVFDFGSGGAAWIRAEGQHWLIDAGPARFHDSVLLPFLRSQGRQSLDGIVMTHGDAGHLGAAVPLLESCPPRHFVSSVCDDRSSHRNRLHAELAARGWPKSLHRPGDRIRFGQTSTLQTLYPPAGIVRSAADDEALIARLDAGDLRILYLSDAGLFTEEWLRRHASDQLRADILIKGAPGGSTSGDIAFLDAVRPRVVIATGADFPASERISPAFAEALAARNIRFFRQDECGAVTVKIFSNRCEVSAFLTGKHYEFLR